MSQRTFRNVVGGRNYSVTVSLIGSKANILVSFGPTCRRDTTDGFLLKDGGMRKCTSPVDWEKEYSRSLLSSRLNWICKRSEWVFWIILPILWWLNCSTSIDCQRNQCSSRLLKYQSAVFQDKVVDPLSQNGSPSSSFTCFA